MGNFHECDSHWPSGWQQAWNAGQKERDWAEWPGYPSGISNNSPGTCLSSIFLCCNPPKQGLFQ